MVVAVRSPAATGWVYAAFAIDWGHLPLARDFSRRGRRPAAGQEPAHRPRAERPGEGHPTRAHAGREVTGVVAHSDKSSQYLAVRYTQRLAEARAVASVDSNGDCYVNALAEAFNSLIRVELVRRCGP